MSQTAPPFTIKRDLAATERLTADLTAAGVTYTLRVLDERSPLEQTLDTLIAAAHTLADAFRDQQAAWDAPL